MKKRIATITFILLLCFSSLTCTEINRYSQFCRSDPFGSNPNADLRFNIGIRNDAHVKFDCSETEVCSYPTGTPSLTANLYTDLNTSQAELSNPCDCQGSTPSNGCVDFTDAAVVFTVEQAVVDVPDAKRSAPSEYMELLQAEIKYLEVNYPEQYDVFRSKFLEK